MADAAPSVPPVTFTSFLISLGSAALVHLGEIPDPQTGAATLDRSLARHAIDVLSLLHEKTKGNLDEDEVRLLDALLYDLRTKYLATPE